MKLQAHPGRALRTALHVPPAMLLARARHETWLRTRRQLGWPAWPQPVKLAPLSLPPLEGAALLRAGQLGALWRAGEVEHVGLRGPRADWAGAGKPRLWRYEHHYNDELTALAALAQVEPAGPWLVEARGLLASWAQACPPERGEAWEPYPVARRLLAWAESAARCPQLAPSLAVLLRPQLDHLRAHLEEHLRGNHLIADAAALVAGAALVQEAWAGAHARFGAALLASELDAQVLPDGAYAERTPQYHALVLRDALLARALAAQRGLAFAADPLLARLAAFLAQLQRADGSWPQLNDSSPASAHVAEDALSFARSAGLLPPAPDAVPARSATARLLFLPDAGLTRVRDSGSELLFLHGALGPPEQPGHAHSHALSFELYWEGAAIVTDSGATTYEPGPVRDFERSARAHATITVDGEGPDELWAAFRAGARGTVEVTQPRALEHGAFLLRAGVRGHQGYRHQRALLFWPGAGLAVLDRVRGAKASARIVARLPLDPAVRFEDGALVSAAAPLALRLLRGTFLREARGELNPREGFVSTGFGKPVPRTTLQLGADADGELAFALLAPGAAAQLAQGALLFTHAGRTLRLPLAEALP